MYALDLFSGIGGIAVGLRDYTRTVAYCENDRYAQSVLLSRMSEGKLDLASIWDDVKTLNGSMLPRIDIIVGGFPCQDISVAGNGAGLGGERSGLFYEIIRLTKETGAPFVFLENVPAIRTRGLREVVRAFTEIGYDCRWTCLSAASIGAPHKRERWFLLATHTERIKLRNEYWRWIWKNGSSTSFLGNNGAEKSLADTESERLERSGNKRKYEPTACSQTESWVGFSGTSNNWWTIEPPVGRVVDGLLHRVDRIKCLGNSVVPAQVKKAFEILMGLNRETKNEDS